MQQALQCRWLQHAKTCGNHLAGRDTRKDVSRCLCGRESGTCDLTVTVELGNAADRIAAALQGSPMGSASSTSAVAYLSNTRPLQHQRASSSPLLNVRVLTEIELGEITSPACRVCSS